MATAGPEPPIIRAAHRTEPATTDLPPQQRAVARPVQPQQPGLVTVDGGQLGGLRPSALGPGCCRRVVARLGLVRSRPQRIAAAESGLHFQQVRHSQRHQFPLLRRQVGHPGGLAAPVRSRHRRAAGGLPAAGVVDQEPERHGQPITAGRHQHRAAVLRFGPFDNPLRVVEHHPGAGRKVQRRHATHHVRPPPAHTRLASPSGWASSTPNRRCHNRCNK